MQSLHACGCARHEQIANVDLQRRRQPSERRQRWHRLAVLDFGNIGTWHLHATGKLTLTQIAAFAKITHRTRHLKAVIFSHGFFRLSGKLRNEPFRFFDFKRFVAAPT